MNITYVLLSPTFGMHQYTADLANRAAQGAGADGGGLGANDGGVQLITTATLPRDRYDPAVAIATPLASHGTGFSREGLDIAAYRRVYDALPAPRSTLPAPRSTLPAPRSTLPAPRSTPPAPRSTPPALRSTPPAQLVHFTGVHAWDLPLVYALLRRGIPVIHTLHDLDPHHGVRFGPLIRLWNRLIIGSGCHLLVHGRRYRDQLLAQGVPAGRVTATPLLHGFLSAERPWPPERANVQTCKRANEVLFFGRVERYKDPETLLAAWQAAAVGGRLIIAGPVAPDVALPPLPPGVELRDRRIWDSEAEALFRSAAVLVLPYRDATQSALVAAAYAYGTPVIVTAAGALAEYVIPGETGWVVPPGDAAALAAALREALADPDRLRRMGAAGRAWFEAERAAETATLARAYASLLAHLP